MGAFLSYIHKPIINHTKNTSNTAIILLQIHSPQNAKQQIKVKPEVPASVQVPKNKQAWPSTYQSHDIPFSLHFSVNMSQRRNWDILEGDHRPILFCIWHQLKDFISCFLFHFVASKRYDYWSCLTWSVLLLIPRITIKITRVK